MREYNTPSGELKTALDKFVYGYTSKEDCKAEYDRICKGMRCNYCDSKFEVAKFKYKGKTSDGKRRQATFKLCITCQSHGVASSQEKICKLWGEEVVEDSIATADGIEMYAY